MAELNKRQEFYQDLLREDIDMIVRLVINCNGMKISTVKNAFEKSLRARLLKLKAVKLERSEARTYAGLSLTCTLEIFLSQSRQRKRLAKTLQVLSESARLILFNSSIPTVFQEGRLEADIKQQPVFEEDSSISSHMLGRLNPRPTNLFVVASKGMHKL
ncbi:hypothetical protein K2173_011196 [Erythroxylum novogranatense]|uniref:Uncharacterized protein n=1 Tax=Erythroxylum novogranatense TaxID=1862640 RepID=A0AAV8U828_9ROSI|nr:hypothetical protein K2173_011196 [Erythroxylum novogranatense]